MCKVIVCLTDCNSKYVNYISLPRELMQKLKSVALEHDIEPEEIYAQQNRNNVGSSR